MRGRLLACLAITALLSAAAPDAAIEQNLARLRVLLDAGDPGHWVSPTGAASWPACESPTPLSGAEACSLATANSNFHLAVGKTVYLRGGTYNTPLKPAVGVSGTLNNRITVRGYPGETARLTNVGAIQPGIEFENNDYFRVLNLTVDTVYQLGYLHGGSSYNEFAFNVLHTGTGPANSGFNIFTIAADDSTANVHNWVHDNQFYLGGQVETTPPMGGGCEDSGGLFNLGADFTNDGVSNYATIENNVFYAGAHHALKVDTRFNVVRNNIVHNEDAYFPASAACQLAVDGAGNLCAPNGFYGNRAITILNNHSAVPAWFTNTDNLIEGNRVGPGGLPSDGNGADALTLGGKRDIVRFNAMYSGQENGVLFRASSNLADNIRFYNNTIYANGKGPACRLPPANPGFVISGIRMTIGVDNNVVINNLLWDNPPAGEIRNTGSGNRIENNWLAANGNPQFMNATLPTIVSSTVPDMSLQAGSGAIDSGVHLALTTNSGSGSTELTADDSTFFQAGTSGSDLVRLNGTMYADEIAIGTVSNRVRIVSVDYATNTITLASAKTWSVGDRIWLTRDSTNRDVLKGSAPDKGAFEREP